MSLLKRIYTAYGMLVFGTFFVVFFIPLLIPIFFPKKHKLVGVFNRWWAKSLFIFLGIPYRLEYKSKLDPNKQYIFAPNHFSFIDIPTMGLNKHNTIFVGKSEMETVPFFGWMYKNLHITVDRTRLKSMYATLIKSMQALDEGKSLTIFIEGGIYTDQPPKMARLKDGAFRAAIEKQIPIVPVTIPHNWILLPVEPMLLNWTPTSIIFHEPVEVAGMTLDDMSSLKEKVYQVIDTELRKQNPGVLKDED
ncbi:MAG TPA: 1-acyl-sn-glycerol-3-phosphate acyltransferase [Cytophagales bacterium]|nr:1-acyl-sn-glycerol-3-phosphate acyltransferase [Cytophagales bacterium]HCR54285.1 1-acyl-sn-glycerol-3-phosphate acyltransferase [Cytophagales bacterium]